MQLTGKFGLRPIFRLSRRYVQDMNTKITTFFWVYLVCLYLLFGGVAALKSTGNLHQFDYFLLFASSAVVCLPIGGLISIALFQFRKSEFNKEHKEKFDKALGMRLGTIAFLVIFTGLLMVTVFKLRMGALAIILGFILGFIGMVLHFQEMARYKKNKNRHITN